MYTDALGDYINHTSIDIGDVSVMQLPGLRVRVRAAGWEGVFSHRTIRKLLIDGAVAAENEARRNFLDTVFRTTDRNAELVAKHGRSTCGYIAPHGIVGQVQALLSQYSL